MDIHAEEGHKIIVTAETINNGFPSDKKRALKYLEVGKTYTVESIDIGKWSSRVFLKEIPTISFNTASFKDLEEKT
jgi:hypothetical protein